MRRCSWVMGGISRHFRAVSKHTCALKQHSRQLVDLWPLQPVIKHQVSIQIILLLSRYHMCGWTPQTVWGMGAALTCATASDSQSFMERNNKSLLSWRWCFISTVRAEHDKLFINRFGIPTDMAGLSCGTTIIERDAFNCMLALSDLVDLLWFFSGQWTDDKLERRDPLGQLFFLPFSMQFHEKVDVIAMQHWTAIILNNRLIAEK